MRGVPFLFEAYLLTERPNALTPEQLPGHAEER
jgi:hypothetical protein